MAIYDFFLSRNGAPVTVANYIGHKGRLFFDDTNGVLRLSDGVTPGGIPIPITTATSTVAGGIKLGPGTTLNPLGQLIIDTAGLDFSFGDFYAFTNLGPSDGACLSSVNADQDIVFVSNGTGGVHAIGSFDVHQTTSTVEAALAAEPIFSIQANGNVRILAPNAGGLAGAVQIVGNSTGAEVAPNQTGVVLHVTGNQDMVSRNYIDGVNNYPLLAGRRYNGTAASPTNVKNGELFFRIAGQASTGTSFATFGPCQIDWVATEDQGPNNQGGELRFRATPNGSSSIAGINTVTTISATGTTSIRFFGPLTGNVTGNADTATKLAATKTINGVAFDGSANINVANTQTLTIGTGLTGSNYNGASASTIALNTATLMASAVTAGTVTAAAQPAITSVGTLTNLSVAGTASATTGTFTKFTGKFIRATRDAGTIGAGGTLTIDFATDALVHCVWSTGLTLAYQNYTAGSVVKVMATKSTGSGNNGITLDGVTAANVSNGSTTTGNYSPDTTAFIELICMNTSISSVYVKL